MLHQAPPSTTMLACAHKGLFGVRMYAAATCLSAAMLHVRTTTACCVLLAVTRHSGVPSASVAARPRHH